MEIKPSVSLIRYTENPENIIALAAKLCYAEEGIDDLNLSVENKDNGKFIKILSKMSHYSPFEHASFSFSIEGVSRSCLAQITRHRLASFSVRSQRYVSEKDFNYVIPPSIKKLGDDAIAKYQDQMATIMSWYQEWQTKLGGNSESSNEDARFILPNACETKMIITMNARELMHFFEARCCNRAQWEIRNIAWLMFEEVIKIAPNVFENCGPRCLKTSCPEGKKCCLKQTEVKEHYQEIIDRITIKD